MKKRRPGLSKVMQLVGNGVLKSGLSDSKAAFFSQILCWISRISKIQFCAQKLGLRCELEVPETRQNN